MCGIVGAVMASGASATAPLIEGLHCLEYRGYDSAGIALLDDGKLSRLRIKGRVAELETTARGLTGGTGIGHTRWATHGPPHEKNAHPLLGGRGDDAVAVVHNGIIENHATLRTELSEDGYEFDSETDTEVIAHLIHRSMSGSKGLLEAMLSSMRRLEGSFAVAAISAKEPGKVICARHGSPLLAGKGEKGSFIASDAPAITSRCDGLTWLEDGDCAEVSKDGIVVTGADGNLARRAVHQIESIGPVAVELGEYRHFMQKEIFEQPEAISATVAQALSEGLNPSLFGDGAQEAFKRARGVVLLACGTSHHATMLGARWIEEIAGIPGAAHISSDFRDRVSRDADGSLVVAVSQSGETADTLAAIKTLGKLGEGGMHAGLTVPPVGRLSISNVRLSSLTHECEMSFVTQAGTEVGVASTKTFVAQSAALLILAGAIAKARGTLDKEEEEGILRELRMLPFTLRTALRCEGDMRSWARKIADCRHALFLGRGACFPIALEGALKLKEISYIHAEGYPAGELKHGPLALVDHDMPVVALAPDDALLGKISANISEVATRGGRLYVVAGEKFAMNNAQIARLPEDGGRLVAPLTYALPMQLLAYHTARELGTDIDKPRNLAKSVTVE